MDAKNFNKANHKSRGLVKIDLILSDLVKTLNLIDSIKLTQLQEAWESMIEPEYVKSTKLMSLDPSGTIIVIVENPTIAYDLNMRKGKLMNDLRSLVKDVKITNIKFDWKYYHKIKSTKNI